MQTINAIPKRDMLASITGCCPPFNPADWDGKAFEFRDKLFMRITTHSIMHVPIDMSSVMTTALSAIQEAGAGNEEYLMLSEDVSPWRAHHYISVDGEVPGAKMVRLSGKYLAKVFEGPFKEIPKWREELLGYVKSQGHEAIKTYFDYTMCPNCAKAYGKNYVIGFAQTAQ